MNKLNIHPTGKNVVHIDLSQLARMQLRGACEGDCEAEKSIRIYCPFDIEGVRSCGA